MRYREPPALATWMLRHLTAGDRDEALDGDLFEVFRLGRSDAWYWRQVAGACVLSWYSNLYARGAVLVFALVWSMLAPLWYAVLEGINTSRNFDKGGQIFGPLWLPLALICWILLHATFLWAGLLVYQLVHAAVGKPVPAKDLRRAFWLVPVILPLVYGATFLIANLYWYSLPGLAHARLAATSWGQISDLGILANFIRLPYFIALLIALWGTVHRIGRNVAPVFGGSRPDRNGTDVDATADWAMPEPELVHRFLAFMVTAGLVNSMIAALFLCRLPNWQSVDALPLVGHALMFVVIGALGGIVGSWLYWISPASPLREGSPVPFSLFALTCVAGWVWVPAMMLFGEQVSWVMAFVAMIGAFLLAMGLRSATYFVFAPAQTDAPGYLDGDLFAESLYRPPLELHGYVIAFGLFAAGAALVARSNYTAAALLAMSAFLFAWKNTVPRHGSFGHDVQMKRAAMRVVSAAVPAVLLTMWALLDGVAHRHQLQASAAAAIVAGSSTKPEFAGRSVTPYGPGGFESVILSPFPEKKEIVPPIAAMNPIFGPSSTRPLVIRFDGVYRYVQDPDEGPGPHAHKAHASPLKVDIQSNNGIGVFMDAHQELATPIPIARCREIQVEIENGDNRKGVISLGIFLQDGSSPRKQTIYLGQQTIVSSEPDQFSIKAAPVSETLHFAVPLHAKIRKFDAITVVVLPDVEHAFVGSKIAIEQFELFPR